jgi:hypothetical protein
MGEDRSLRVGLAGASLFVLGIVGLLGAVLAILKPDAAVYLGLLGDDFAIPVSTFLLVSPVAIASVVAGMLTMLGQSMTPARIASAIWTSLGLMATAAGAAPGLLLVGAVTALFLWRGPRRSLPPAG